MSACPAAAELERWMREGRDPSPDAATRLHVEGCATCQLRLGQLRTSQRRTLRRTAEAAVSEGQTLIRLDQVDISSQATLEPGAVERGDDSDAKTGEVPGPDRLLEPSDDSDAKTGEVASPGRAFQEHPPTQDGRAPRLAAQGHEPGDTVGRFVVLQRIGEGGMGMVYAAYDPELDRKVAIKLLRSDIAGARADDLRNRLLREAQAMARLSHPNVIPVYDVGTLDGQVFVAMEFVEGKVLSAHLRGVADWRAVVGLYLQAGAGLAAAHAAGLIHRDFKPQNVLVSSEGVVRVLDFGLARPAGQSEPPKAAPPSGVPVPVGSRSPSGRPLLQTPLTQSDLVLGTPAYMPPEQFRAGLVDARSDQFAFCVSLFEALYGVRPFSPDTLGALLHAIEKGEVVPAPKGTKVPTRLYRLLKRGLSADPAQRWPSMAELLAELKRDPQATTRRVLAGAAVALLAAAAVGGSVWSSRQQRLLCSGAQDRLEGAWDDRSKAALLRAFVETKVPYAPAVFATATRLLDSYTSDWVRMRTDACEATRLRGEQSERLLDLRIQCLDRKLNEVSAVLDLFKSPNVGIVDRAVPAVQQLGALSECADARALGAEPASLTAEERVDQDAAFEKLAQARAAAVAADPQRALDAAAEGLQLAERSRQSAAVAQARLLLAELKGKQGDDRGAENELLQGTVAAETAKRDDLRARALTELSLAVFKEGRTEESLNWGQLANAALARSGGNDAVQARLHHILALAFHALGRSGDAVAHFGRCLDLRKKAFGADSYMAAASMQAFGSTLHQQGKLDDAVQHLRKAVELQVQTLGQNHPDVGAARQALASALRAKGDFEAAETEQRAALESIVEPVLKSGAHSELATILVDRGQLKAALPEAETALTQLLSVLPKEHPSLAQAYVQVSTLRLGVGDRRGALAAASSAAAALDPSKSPALLAQATLLEAKAEAGKAGLKKAKAVLAKLPASASKDASVQALRAFAEGHGSASAR